MFGGLKPAFAGNQSRSKDRGKNCFVERHELAPVDNRL